MNPLFSQFLSYSKNNVQGFHLINKNLEVKEFLSFENLLKRSLSIAHSLQEKGIKQNDYAILMYAPGIEFIAALLAVQIIGAIPVPTYPPFSKSGFLRLLSIKNTLNVKNTLVDDQVNDLLFSQSILNNQMTRLFMKMLKKDVPFTSEDFDHISNLNVINTENIFTKEIKLSDLTTLVHEIGLIQFTSGSISEPKGVVLTFQNLISNIKAIQVRMQINKNSRIFAWVPQYHDMGLVAGILTSLYTGCNLYIMSPFDFIRKPSLWIKALDKFRITHTGGPNFSYELCLKKVNSEEIKDIDLSCAQVLINGAEPVKHSTMRNFIDKFSQYGLKATSLVPAYGLAEASLLVTSNNAHDPLSLFIDKTSLTSNLLKISNAVDAVPLVNNGKPIDDHEIIIFDDEKKDLCADLEIGEILISGNSVTSGYINSSEPSFLMKKDNQLNEKVYLRTGDLGFLYQGNLYVTGRKKDLIIYRGKNYYPQDIEHIAETCSSNIRKGCSAAFLDENTEDIILVAEICHPKNDPSFNEQICEHIKANISASLDIVVKKIILIFPSSIAKTTSGKIQRSKIKKQYKNLELRSVYTYE